MAMLAGPRRKQKVINLRAKNSAWSNDSNKFGQRMLEKMGWSSGKGLGANENGIVEHVIAKYKNDEKGLGFEDKNDQWTKHEDDFNALLSNLSNASADDEKLHSGISLEVKSKKSKARVHYHKFTRGKDLTRYSEKDLANIFGKKSLKQNAEVEEDIKETPKDDVKITEKIFTEKGSMEDYFKNKLANFKGKSLILKSKIDTEGDDADFAFKGFSTNSDDIETTDTPGLGFSFYSSDSTTNEKNKENGHLITEEVTEEEQKSKKLKKKKKRSRQTSDDHEYNVTSNEDHSNTNTNTLDSIESSNIKKSKKKHKLEVKHNEPEEVPNKKKSKSKNCDKQEEFDEQNHDDYVPKKKKKKKDKNVEI